MGWKIGVQQAQRGGLLSREYLRAQLHGPWTKGRERNGTAAHFIRRVAVAWPNPSTVSGAVECLLPVGGQDGSARTAPNCWIPPALPVLLDDTRASLRIPSWAPGNGFDDHLDVAPRGYGDKSEPQQATKLRDA